MMNLFITIALTTLLYLIFKSFQRFHIATFQAVVFNYITCVVVGSLFSSTTDTAPMFQNPAWLYLSALMGVLFISAFYLMAWSAQKISVTVSTISSKMSMIVPILFSLFYLKVELTNAAIYCLGLLVAIISIFLSTKQPRSNQKSESFVLYAILIFVLTGIVDTTINFSTAHYGYLAGFAQWFPVSVFSVASSVGVIVLIFNLLKKKEPFSFRSSIAGVLLGIPNYFSIYFLMQALTDFKGNGAFVFPVMSIGVIVLSSLLAWLIFNEKLKPINVWGIVCAVIAIAIISYQELITYLSITH